MVVKSITVSIYSFEPEKWSSLEAAYYVLDIV